MKKKKVKKDPVVTKKPDGTTGERVTQQQINFGNVERTKLEILGNMNQNIFIYCTDMIAEQKKTNRLLAQLVKKKKK